MQVHCPSCGREYRIKPENEGRKIRCKECAEVFTARAATDDIEDFDDLVEEPVRRTKRRPTKKKRRPAPVGSSVSEAPPPRSTSGGKSRKPAPKREKKAKQDDDEDEATPLGMIGFGLFAIAAGVVLYFVFDHLESEGGSVRMPVILIALYEFTGKVGTLLICAGIGLLSLVMGVVGMAKGE